MQTTHSGPRRPGPGRFFLTFGYIWVTVGLFTASVTLLMARPPLLSALHAAGAGELAEYRAVFALVLAVGLGSILLARRVARQLLRRSPAHLHPAGLGLLALSAVLCLWAWSRPDKLVAGDAADSAVSDRAAATVGTAP